MSFCKEIYNASIYYHFYYRFNYRFLLFQYMIFELFDLTV